MKRIAESLKLDLNAVCERFPPPSQCPSRFPKQPHWIKEESCVEFFLEACLSHLPQPPQSLSHPPQPRQSHLSKVPGLSPKVNEDEERLSALRQGRTGGGGLPEIKGRFGEDSRRKLTAEQVHASQPRFHMLSYSDSLTVCLGRVS